MKTKTTIGDVAEIRAGYTSRGRMECDPEGAVAVIQNKDIADGRVNLSALERLPLAAGTTMNRVHGGDIVFRTKGASFCFALVEQEPERETIVAAPLSLMRVREGAGADPAYLAWLLSQERMQAVLNSVAQGTLMKVVSKSALERLELTLPPMEEQRRVAEIARLSAEVCRMTHELADMRAAYVQAKLLQES